MDRELRILLVEDVRTDAELEIRELRRAGMRVTHRLVETEGAFRDALRDFGPELIISDFSMPHFDGMWALSLARELAPQVPFIFVSGTIGEEYAIRALKNGATDYVLKNNLVRLPAAVERALQDSIERAARRRAEQELEETRSRLDSIVSSLSDVVWSVSLQPYRTLYISRAVEAVWGRPVEDFQANAEAWLEQIHVDDREPVERLWRGALRGGVFDAVYRIARENGSVRWIHDRAKAIYDDAGAVVRLDGIARDVTDLKQQEQGIARLSRIHAVLSGINSAIVRIRDRQQLLDEACRIAVEHGGFGMAWIGVISADGAEIVPVASAGLDDSDFLKRAPLQLRGVGARERGLIAHMLEEGRAAYSNDVTLDADSGGERRAEAIRRGYRSIIALPLLVDGSVFGNMSLFAKEPDFFTEEELKLLNELAGDISFALDHISKEEKLHYLAYYDALTGLPNRELFNEQVAQLIQSAGPAGVAMVVIDLVRFGSINETLGINAGDAVLKRIAGRLGSAVGDDGTVARTSGDRFSVALTGMRDAAEIAHILTQRVLPALSEPFTERGQELRITGRAGIAVYPNDGNDAAGLFLNAEAARAKAKQSGDHFLFYAPQMNARVAEQLKLETDLRRAVLEEQFVLYYQPRIDLASGRVSGLEALIRWAHPERGLVPPGEFIPLLEATGLILEVGKWALKRSALDHAVWRSRQINAPRIAVNVSAIQLSRKDFVADVKAALTEAGDSREHIDVEITESMLMEDLAGNIEKLKAVREMGIQIAMDDFGTGYSSLSYLSKLPINSLKIDRSFISQMSQSPEQMAIVSTIISLARALNLKVVAEGVETEEQANLLRLLRCDEVQGYLFGRPSPPADLEKLLSKP